MILRNTFIGSLCVVFVAQSLGAREQTLMQDLPVIMVKLQSADARIRNEAETELTRRAGEHLSADEGFELLRQAATLPGGAKDDRHDASAVLVRTAALRSDELYVPIVRQIFPKLTPAGKYEALELLVRIHSASAAKLFVNLLHDHAATVREVPLGTLGQNPEFGEIYFPALLQIAGDTPHLGESTYLLALDFALAKKVEAASLEKSAPSIIAAYKRRHQRLAPQQQPTGAKWIWTEAYQADREPAGVLLDLMGFLPAQNVEAALKQAMALTDPRLKLFAAVSLVRLEEDIPYRDLEAIAASAETRAALFENLQKLNRLDLFPEKHRTQSALAESCMVRWLVYPTELGRTPDAIELMKVLPAADTARGDYYVFRFRTDDPKDSDWKAGVAGPFKRSTPTAQGDADTFSRFDKWEGATAEQHLAKNLDTLGKAREPGSK